jgi:predicted SprT family Zn-dependent metalloprotease
MEYIRTRPIVHRHTATNMDTPCQDARAVALSLMARHGLLAQGWQFLFDNAQTRAGRCNETTKTISLSKYLPAAVAGGDVRDTVLHEIAHALVGCHHGHDDVWRAKALAIGCSGARCHSHVLQEAPWTISCPCGFVRASRFKVPDDAFLASRTCKQCTKPLTATNAKTGEVRGGLAPTSQGRPAGYRYLVTCPCGHVHCPRKVLRKELLEKPRTCKQCKKSILIVG